MFSRKLKGDIDIAIVKIDVSTGQILQGTYIGGSKIDNADGIFVDTTGDVFISGETESVDFPVTDNSFQPVKDSGKDAFILLLKPDFSRLLYCTFFGGNNDDRFRSGFLGQDGALYGIGTSNGAGLSLNEVYT